MCQMWTRIRKGIRWVPQERFALALKAVNLKDVKTIKISLDPFNQNNQSIREFWHGVSSSKIRMTNPTVKIIPEIRCDRGDPFILTELANGQKYKFHTANFPSGDLVSTFNRITSK